jgi:hypothetical protein
MEKAAAAELANSANVIKHTGMFDIVDRVYGDFQLALKGGAAGGAAGGEEGGAEGGGGGGGGLGGSFGGGGAGGEDLDFGGESEADTEAGGEEGAAEAGAEAGEEEVEGIEGTEPTEVAETIKRVEKLLTERKTVLAKELNDRAKRYKGRFVDRLIESVKPEPSKMADKVKIYDKNVKVNREIDDMINDIDKMLDE